ncbi:hypothetical protein HDU97_005515 [Phlyctochytrium planicorne]|nr:hypothetical protein HDU97_005515 [Phlyctochytrium planicorne]
MSPQNPSPPHQPPNENGDLSAGSDAADYVCSNDQHLEHPMHRLAHHNHMTNEASAAERDLDSNNSTSRSEVATSRSALLVQSTGPTSSSAGTKAIRAQDRSKESEGNSPISLTSSNATSSVTFFKSCQFSAPVSSVKRPPVYVCEVPTPILLINEYPQSPSGLLQSILKSNVRVRDAGVGSSGISASSTSSPSATSSTGRVTFCVLLLFRNSQDAAMVKSEWENGGGEWAFLSPEPSAKEVNVEKMEEGMSVGFVSNFWNCVDGLQKIGDRHDRLECEERAEDMDEKGESLCTPPPSRSGRSLTGSDEVMFERGDNCHQHETFAWLQGCGVRQSPPGRKPPRINTSVRLEKQEDGSTTTMVHHQQGWGFADSRMRVDPISSGADQVFDVESARSHQFRQAASAIPNMTRRFWDADFEDDQASPTASLLNDSHPHSSHPSSTMRWQDENASERTLFHSHGRWNSDTRSNHRAISEDSPTSRRLSEHDYFRNGQRPFIGWQAQRLLSALPSTRSFWGDEMDHKMQAWSSQLNGTGPLFAIPDTSRGLRGDNALLRGYSQMESDEPEAGKISTSQHHKKPADRYPANRAVQQPLLVVSNAPRQLWDDQQRTVYTDRSFTGSTDLKYTNISVNERQLWSDSPEFGNFEDVSRIPAYPEGHPQHAWTAQRPHSTLSDTRRFWGKEEDALDSSMQSATLSGAGLSAKSHAFPAVSNGPHSASADDYYEQELLNDHHFFKNQSVADITLGQQFSSGMKQLNPNSGHHPFSVNPTKALLHVSDRNPAQCYEPLLDDFWTEDKENIPPLRSTFKGFGGSSLRERSGPMSAPPEILSGGYNHQLEMSAGEQSMGNLQSAGASPMNSSIHISASKWDIGSVPATHNLEDDHSAFHVSLRGDLCGKAYPLSAPPSTPASVSRSLKSPIQKPTKSFAPPVARENDLNLFNLGKETRTTVMLKNVPNRYTQEMLMEFLDETHKGAYDFVYLRMDFRNRPKFNSDKIPHLCFANIQGRDALIEKFRNSSVMQEDPSYRPKLLDSMGREEEFPGPTAGGVRPKSDVLFSRDGVRREHHVTNDAVEVVRRALVGKRT